MTAGYKLADIGTDHAYIPIALVEQNRIPGAIAMDINEGPLQRAGEHIAENKMEKKIEIRGLDKVEPLNICADEDMINQVVYNLIDNAVKFTNEGGYIEVAIKSDSEKMIFSVKNSGKGISREEAGKVFERFYKTDKSRSYDVKGAGLGLYIVKTIIDMHGGQITVNSEPGEYTQFVFWLPLR